MTKIIHVPIENHILDTYDFKYFADYFRKSYEEFMGVSTKEIKYNIYTLEEQIDMLKIFHFGIYNWKKLKNHTVKTKLLK